MDSAVGPVQTSSLESPAGQQPSERWRAAFENSAIGIMMADFSGRFFAANSAFRKLLGYSELELYRLTFIDVTCEEDRERNLDLVWQLTEGKRQHFELEKRLRRKDGTLVWVRSNVALVPGMGDAASFWFAVVENITERRRAEEESATLRDELAAELAGMTRLHEFSTHLLAISELKGLLEEVLDATIALQNADFGNIQLYNPETDALDIVAQRGFKQDFLEHFRNVRYIGATCGRAMKLRERVIVENVEADVAFAEHRAIAASAGFQAVQSTPLFSRGGEFLGVLSTHFRKPHRPSLRDLRFTDLYARYAAEIIERRCLEQARQQAQQALQATRAELARVSRVTTMGELVASIAHEVNQPLTAIINNASACLRLLADRNLDPAVLSRVLEEIVADGERASTVIARIRAFIKKAPAEERELEVNDVIQEVLALTSHELHENRVLLEYQPSQPLPLVRGDRVQLQQVLLNLIMNGIEAMTGVTDRPRFLRVLSEIDETGCILVTVYDSGIGLGAAADLIFDPFFTTKASGMGMGLSISRSLVEGHGGRLWATPNFPHGAAFSFMLPTAGKSSS